MSMQYAVIFNGRKNGNYYMKKFDVLLIFAQNIDCGLLSTHDLCFRAKIRK